MRNRFGTALAGFCVATALAMTQAQAANQIVMDLKCGPVVIDLRADLAPKHVRQITTLAADGFYDGIVFHRVIDGFMAQTGDPTGTGTGGPNCPIFLLSFPPNHLCAARLAWPVRAAPTAAIRNSLSCLRRTVV